MPQFDSAGSLTVIATRNPGAGALDPANGGPDPADGRPDHGVADAEDRVAAEVLAALDGEQVHFTGRRPGKEIDQLLSGRILVIGDDADLAAVATRLQRRELLAAVEVAYAPVSRTPVAQLWSLPVGARSVPLARRGDPDLVPLLRDDKGGVLVGEATIGPVRGSVYIDEYRVLNGPARGLIIQPDAAKGLSVTVVYRRVLMFGRRPISQQGRALEINVAPTRLIADGRERETPVDRWNYYKHTEPMRLVRGVVD
jgi:hypothetical protein